MNDNAPKTIYHSRTIVNRTMMSDSSTTTTDNDTTTTDSNHNNNNNNNNTPLEATAKYRKSQLDQITTKFQKHKENASPTKKNEEEPLHIDTYDQVQPMWKDMESRVLRRKLPPKIVAIDGGGGDVVPPPARSNIRQTDEEAWLAAGLYDTKDDDDDDKKERQ